MYQSEGTALANALTSSNSPVFTNDTIQQILNLTTSDGTSASIHQTDASGGGTFTVPSGTEIVFFSNSGHGPTTITPPNGPEVFVFQGLGGVNVQFNDGNAPGGGNGQPDRVIVGTGGNDHFVLFGGLDNHVVLGPGNDTVVAGSGDDTIVAGQGNSTIDGGAGRDLIKMGGQVSDYQVVVASNPASAEAGLPQAARTAHVVVTNSQTGVTTDITGVQYVQLDGGDALIFADSTVEAGIATLYQTVFGRTGDAGGIEFWFDFAGAGASLRDIANEFAHTNEFRDKAASLSDTEFLNQLYLNTFNRTPDADGLAFWQTFLAGHTRADVMTEFAAIGAKVLDGTIHTDVTVVGSVTIVPDIV